MAKRQQTYGSITVVPKSTILKYITNSGSNSQFVRTARPSYIRRTGRTSIIVSSSGRDGRFRPCSHSQEHYLCVPLSVTPPAQYAALNQSGPSGYKTGWIYNLVEDVHANRYSNFIGGVNNASVSIASVQWDSLGQTALQSMLPSFHTKNSLVNFVLELKDFKSVVKYMAGGLKKRLSAMEALLGFKRSDKPLKKLSKSYLSYSFGWRPLFSDLVAFVETISKFNDRYRELMQREGAPQQSYWGTWIAGTATGESTYYNNGTGDGPNGGWIGPFLGKYRFKVVQAASQGIRYHATVRYRYQAPDELRSIGGKVKAFLDLLGVARNPAILWNAIPFSFIVDWFVNVSGYLERFRLDNIQFKTEILDFCHSARFERKIDCLMAGENYDSTLGYIPLSWQVIDSCRKVVYERKVGYPNFLTAIQTSGLSLREFSLGGALLNARTKK